MTGSETHVARAGAVAGPALVVLAAGEGSRYGGLKQLAPMGPGGATLLEYSVYDARRAGFGSVVLVVRPETEARFRDRLDGTMGRRMPLRYVHQVLDDLPAQAALLGRSKPWGTGQAVLAAEPAVGATFAVVNADDFYGADSFASLGRWLAAAGPKGEPRGAVVGFPVEQTLSAAGPVSRAVCRVGRDGLLEGILEIKDVWRRDGQIVYHGPDGVERSLRGDELVSMNMWGFTRSLFPELAASYERFRGGIADSVEAEFLLPEEVQRMIVGPPRLRVDVVRGVGPWCGVTFRDDDRRVAGVLKELVARGQYPETLWA